MEREGKIGNPVATLSLSVKRALFAWRGGVFHHWDGEHQKTPNYVNRSTYTHATHCHPSQPRRGRAAGRFHRRNCQLLPSRRVHLPLRFFIGPGLGKMGWRRGRRVRQPHLHRRRRGCSCPCLAAIYHGFVLRALYHIRFFSRIRHETSSSNGVGEFKGAMNGTYREKEQAWVGKRVGRD